MLKKSETTKGAMMMRDLTGRVFERLTVIEIGTRDKSGRVLWRCKCLCGNETLTRSDLLIGGLSKSCGCLAKELTAKRATIHDHCKNRQFNGNGTYVSWKGMKQRCYNKKHDQYIRYGALGITVSERWKNSFKNFLEDMGERPEGTSIDRINPHGNYEPGNCRWANCIEQNNNQKNTKYYIYNNNKKTISQWSREIGFTPNTIYSRLKRGWSFDKAIETPIDTRFHSRI